MKNWFPAVWLLLLFVSWLCGSFLLYLLGTSTVAFILFGIDKRSAVNGSRRIPEAFLLLWCIAGGTPGAVLAMQLFRHKTRKVEFFVPVLLIFIIQITVTILVWRKA